MNFKNEEILAGWEDILTKKYQLKIAEIADSYPAKRSIYVSYRDIDEYNSDMAMFITDHPDKCLELGRKKIKEMMPPAWDDKGTVNLRLTELPKDGRVEIRNLRQEHLKKFIAIEGLVRKTTQPKPRMTNALFVCTKCDAEQWVEQRRLRLRRPSVCTNQDGSCNRASAQFTLMDDRSIYIDTQMIEIQEFPEGLRGGAQPGKLSGYLDDDIAGVAFPGNRVTINGIIRPVQKGERDDSLVFETFMEIHSIEFEQSEYEEITITEDDEKEIHRMAADPDLFKNIVRSVAPTIHGLETEKEAIALQLFGGTPKVLDDKTTIRGDIHILLIGDPGVAKSQLLRYMSELAPRGIYASGKSASSAGLCVHGDTILYTDSGDATIKEFVEKRMTSPEEYKEGIWRQAVSDGKVISITEKGFPEGLPVSHVWKIRTPPHLIELVSENDDKLMLTPETKVLARDGMIFDWTKASEIRPGMLALITDKGKMNPKATEIKEVRIVTENMPEYVYDLTVKDAHSFMGNGFAVHNTAAAVKDDFGEGRWTLEAGALVLADKGLACVDELDKMREEDTSSLHEAMESQRISVAKAGISATLQCRCSLLAAANPKRGRFTDGDLGEQINLPPALMSRFDMIFTLKDRPDKDLDKKITDHILKAHRRGQAKKSGNGKDKERILGETDDLRPVYEPEMMRKYVAYSKRIVPVMTDEAVKKIGDNYLGIRSMGGGENRSVPITARQLEAYVRLSEASAKARLSDTVTEDDADRSIRIIHYFLDKVIGGEGNTVWDIDNIATGTTVKTKDEMDAVSGAINDYYAENGIGISKGELMSALVGQMDEKEVMRILGKMINNGEVYEPQFETYRLVRLD